MSDQSIFDGNQAADNQGGDNANQQQPAGDQPAANPDQTLLASIVDENGRQKYATTADAIKALAHGQQYIDQLHQKVDEGHTAIANLQQEVNSRRSVQDAIDGMQNGANQNPSQSQEVNQPTGLSAEAAEDLFNGLITKSRQKEVRSTNESAVISALSQKFGDKAEEMFLGKATELGLTVADLNNLSGTSPKAVLAYFGAESADTSLDVSQGTVNTESVGQDTERPLVSRNHGDSVLSGSTTREVRAEYDLVKEMVANMHEKGVSVSDLTDPKEYEKHFGPQAN